MTCEYKDLCRKMAALREIQKNNGFSASDYPITELKCDICDHTNPEAREICPAYQDISVHDRASWWVK